MQQVNSPNRTTGIAPATLAYYNDNANQYFRSTVAVDMTPMYERFLQSLAVGALILDAGCGSGRDTKAFLDKGYRVLAIDASPIMAELASRFTGQRCEVLAFEDITQENTFDGIWACASLLHVTKRQIGDVLGRLIRALKPGGVMYVSLKEGVGERVVEDGRFFSYYTADEFRRLINSFPEIGEITTWASAEVRSVQHPGPWLNVLLKKM